MSYLDQFEKHIANHDYPQFLSLWEEYCLGDEIDPDELRKILETVKKSELAAPFGRHVENALVLWEKISSAEHRHAIIKLIFDLQTTNSTEIANIALDYIRKTYPDDPNFNEKLRLIGLRECESFQGAVSNYELLTHLKKGNFVFHSGGWGVGQISDVSLILEQVEIEFDYVPGSKELSFKNAFNTLCPLSEDHFLSRRFGDPDRLEDYARNKPLEVIQILLKDLGPLSAQEIKEELCELVIPEKDWSKWWQYTRSKIKKSTLISSPKTTRGPFNLRDTEISYDEIFEEKLKETSSPLDIITLVYNFKRDFPEIEKKESTRKIIIEKIEQVLSSAEIDDSIELQLHIILEDASLETKESQVNRLIEKYVSPEDVINKIGPVSLKRKALQLVKTQRGDWHEVYEKLFLQIDQNILREYILGELLHAKQDIGIITKLDEIIEYPDRYPAAIIWYFQKVFKDSSLPLSTNNGKNRLFEALLILLNTVEQDAERRDLVKKLLTIFTNSRFNTVRQIFQIASLEEIKEYLLLVTKCSSFSDHDVKIFHSLAEVVYPELATISKKYRLDSESEEEETFWTTEESYKKAKERIQRISTIETVENAKEIEEARELGDLRENAEFKAALERRDRLQGELKDLSAQYNKARILTKNDVNKDQLCVGTTAECTANSGEIVKYTILGPWEADPEENILSCQSKLAKELIGKKTGEVFEVQQKKYTITKIYSIFDIS